VTTSASCVEPQLVTSTVEIQTDTKLGTDTLTAPEAIVLVAFLAFAALCVWMIGKPFK
jgi:hypothetical protein